MLVDYSVWIAYLRGDDLVEVSMLTEALEHRESVWLTATILQEVLQGADSPERFTRWDRVLGELPSITGPTRGNQRAAQLICMRDVNGQA